MIPKFRAWFSEASQMITDGLESINLFNETVTITSRYYDNFADVYDFGSIEVDIGNAILMQYTGCRDKNGIEIYEGDVIKDKYDKTWLVQWYVGAFVITDKIPDSDGQTTTYSHFSNVSNHHFYFDVIGNIYENPELLEEVTK